MKLRKDQIEGLAGPSNVFPRFLVELLQMTGVEASYEPESRDVYLPGREHGQLRLSFDRGGRVQGITDVTGRVHHVSYEGSRPVAVTDAGGARTELLYDAHGYIEGYRSPLGREVRKRRLGPQQLQCQFGAGAIDVRLGRADTLTSVTTPTGASSHFQYDGLDRLVGYRDENGYRTRLDYEAGGGIRNLRTPGGRSWRFDDVIAERPVVVYPDGKRERYDLEDGFRKHTRRDGSIVCTGTDDRGRIAMVSFPGGQVDMGYNDRGHLASVDGEEPVAYEFDEDGFRTAEQCADRRVVWTYDAEAQHRVTGLTNHRGQSVAYRYGPAQRVVEVNAWEGMRFQLGWDAEGNLTRIQHPNGWEEVRTYAPEVGMSTQRLAPLHGLGQSSGIERAYRRDAADALEAVIDSELGPLMHRYDAAQQLTGLSGAAGEHSYSYDPDGNLVSRDGVRLQYDALDQLIDGPGGARSYDDNGCLVERTGDAGTTRYAYDGRLLLESVELPDGCSAQYTYDALGRRSSKRVGETLTRYTWQGTQLVAEDTEGPLPEQRDYLYVPGTGELLAMRVDGAVYLYQNDHLGTPVRLLDVMGQVVWEARAVGFGFHVTKDRVRQPFRFPGQYHDQETGLHYNNARYYDPDAARYITPDPLFLRSGLNRYLYARNCPSTLTDPSGFIIPLVAAGFVGLMGAGAVGWHTVATAAVGNDVGSTGEVAANMGKAFLIGAGTVLGAAAGAALATGGAAIALGIAAGVLANVGIGMALDALHPPPGPAPCFEQLLLSNIPGWDLFQAATDDYQGKGLNNPEGQRAVDIAFGAIGFVLDLFGAYQGVRKGGPKTKTGDSEASSPARKQGDAEAEGSGQPKKESPEDAERRNKQEAEDNARRDEEKRRRDEEAEQKRREQDEEAERKRRKHEDAKRQKQEENAEPDRDTLPPGERRTGNKPRADHTAERYALTDSENGRFKAVAYLRDGELEIDIRTQLPDGTRSSQLRGREQFRKIMEYFGADNIKAVKGNWQYETNLRIFRTALSEGKSPAEAAQATWTGQRAKEFGFTTVEQPVRMYGPEGNPDSVRATFTR